jgi:DNA-binding PadR family transcriptional regulator
MHEPHESPWGRRYGRRDPRREMAEEMVGRMLDDAGPGRGRGRHGRPGGRTRRGDIRTALLIVLGDAPGHGYDLIQRVEEASGGWRPSPGSVYPTLQLLEDEGLVRSSELEGKRVYEITDDGRADSTRRVEEAGGTPWENAGPPTRHRELREAVFSLMSASKQLAVAGSDEQLDRGLAIIKDARKQLYLLLGED